MTDDKRAEIEVSRRTGDLALAETSPGTTSATYTVRLSVQYLSFSTTD